LMKAILVSVLLSAVSIAMAAGVLYGAMSTSFMRKVPLSDCKANEPCVDVEAARIENSISPYRFYGVGIAAFGMPALLNGVLSTILMGRPHIIVASIASLPLILLEVLTDNSRIGLAVNLVAVVLALWLGITLSTKIMRSRRP
jgi:hypothetical protein